MSEYVRPGLCLKKGNNGNRTIEKILPLYANIPMAQLHNSIEYYFYHLTKQIAHWHDNEKKKARKK